MTLNATVVTVHLLFLVMWFALGYLFGRNR